MPTFSGILFGLDGRCGIGAIGAAGGITVDPQPWGAAAVPQPPSQPFDSPLLQQQQSFDLHLCRKQCTLAQNFSQQPLSQQSVLQQIFSQQFALPQQSPFIPFSQQQALPQQSCL